jgi:pimeloyl-ACP methyl ester carboxylesterase
MKTEKVKYKNENVNGVNIAYRETGNKSKPTILLLGGFPSSSIIFRPLIEELKNDYHLIAPDYPGFGNSEVPSKDSFEYTFENISKIIEKFIDQIGLEKFSLYAFDYGGPIGFRIAARRPELIETLIVQNANAYAEGIGSGFDNLMPFLNNRNDITEQPIRSLFSLEGVKLFYFAGAENPELINPDTYFSDLHFLSRPGLIDIHLDILENYPTNIGQYDNWHSYFKTHQPPTLLVWGKNDPFFPESAARAFQKDLKNTELYLYNTGHSALEEFGIEIAQNVKTFLNINIK